MLILQIIIGLMQCFFCTLLVILRLAVYFFNNFVFFLFSDGVIIFYNNIYDYCHCLYSPPGGLRSDFVKFFIKWFLSIILVQDDLFLKIVIEMFMDSSVVLETPVDLLKYMWHIFSVKYSLSTSFRALVMINPSISFNLAAPYIYYLILFYIFLGCLLYLFVRFLRYFAKK